MSYILLSAASACRPPATTLTNFDIEVQSHQEICNHCIPSERGVEEVDLQLATVALRVLLLHYLKGRSIAQCPDVAAGSGPADGTIVITKNPEICNPDCRKHPVRLASTVEAARRLPVQGYWRLLKLDFIASVSVQGRDGILLECSTGHRGELDTLTMVLAVRRGRTLIFSYQGSTISQSRPNLTPGSHYSPDRGYTHASQSNRETPSEGPFE
jgi:hypothetical protein